MLKCFGLITEYHLSSVTMPSVKRSGSSHQWFDVILFYRRPLDSLIYPICSHQDLSVYPKFVVFTLQRIFQRLFWACFIWSIINTKSRVFSNKLLWMQQFCHFLGEIKLLLKLSFVSPWVKLTLLFLYIYLYSMVQKSWAFPHFFIFYFQTARLSSNFSQGSRVTVLQAFWRSLKVFLWAFAAFFTHYSV